MSASGLLVPEISEIRKRIHEEVGKIIVGQSEAIDLMLIALLCKGHVLLIGVPGLAKTLLVNSFAKSLNLNFRRIQFTPDLMPSDITGMEILQEDRTTGKKEFLFNKGPVFTNVLLGDEINRTPPKTQSALLEAMQEGKVTVFGRTQELSDPFMVLATQNPIEQEGTYPLPEAQLDRFLISIRLEYPDLDQEIEIIKRHSSSINETLKSILNPQTIKKYQFQVLEMSVPDHVLRYVVDIIRNTRPGGTNSLVNQYVQWGAGPRAGTGLLLAAKTHAFLHGQPIPAVKNVQSVLFPCLGHRILLNFHAEAENIKINDILNSLKNI